MTESGSPPSGADARKIELLMQNSPGDEVSLTEEREANRTAWHSSFEPKLPDDPLRRWLYEVEDACFQAGRRWERQERVYRRPWWRFWDYAQRMSIRHGPYSRVRVLLEPEAGAGAEEVGYREQWRIRYPCQPQWDFLLRFLWLFARDSRLRCLIAPDKK
jgi:hypothetical protein